MIKKRTRPVTDAELIAKFFLCAFMAVLIWIVCPPALILLPILIFSMFGREERERMKELLEE